MYTIDIKLIATESDVHYRELLLITRKSVVPQGSILEPPLLNEDTYVM